MPVKQPTPDSNTLDQQEMRCISEAISRNYTPRFFRSRAPDPKQIQFSSQELREISRQIGREHGHLGDQRQSRLALLPVAPGHLHAYWQLAPQLSAASEVTSTQTEEPETKQLTLRIYRESEPAPNPTPVNHDTHIVVDIPLPQHQGHQDIQLPLPDGDENRQPSYQASLGWHYPDHPFQVIVDSASAAPGSPPRLPPQQADSPALQQSIMAHRRPETSMTSRSGQGKEPEHE